MSTFYEVEPTLENYWRAIILFGRNVASYKFALAKALCELKDIHDDLISLEKLAEPFSRHLCEHLIHAPKQITSKSSKFLEACSRFNQKEISKGELIDYTVTYGFNNVIDAFHFVNKHDVPKRFFIDERKTSSGIRITKDFFQLTKSKEFASFINETEARWRLVEEGWRAGISRSLISIKYDKNLRLLFAEAKQRRVNIASCRDSLNGYQKGRCFYCFRPISIIPGEESITDVDHFLPFILKDNIDNINGIWNLVLACQECNRGVNGKFERVPSVDLLKRLHKRNEYFIDSHLPLRETLIQQSGKDELSRRSFLQGHYDSAKRLLIHSWYPKQVGPEKF